MRNNNRMGRYRHVFRLNGDKIKLCKKKGKGLRSWWETEEKEFGERQI